jgi:hypothetical protein
MPSKAACFEAAFLKAFAAAAWTKVVATEFFLQQFVFMDEADAALHFLLRGVPLASFAHPFEKNG